MNIQTKLIVIFSAVVAIVGSGVVFSLDSYLRGVFSEAAKTSLKSVAEVSEGVYFVFTENLKTRTIDWSSDNYVRNMAEKLTSTQGVVEKSAVSAELNDYFRKNKITYDPSVIIVDLIDRNGVVIASSRPDRVGVNEGEEEKELGAVRFSEALTSSFGETFVSSFVREEDESDRDMIHVTARVFSNKKNPGGSFIPLDSVLLVHFHRADELASMLNGSWQEAHGALSGNFFGSIRQNGEVYLVGSDGGILTAPTLEKNGIIGKKVNEGLTASCFNEGREIAEEYVNYDGIKVSGATMCIKRDNMMLVVEMPSEEVMEPLETARRMVALATVFAVLLVIFGSFLLNRFLLKPISAIVLAAQKVARGELDIRANVNSKDEIGYLALVFNEMLDSIGKFQKELSVKTKELSEKVLSIEKQNKTLEEGKKAMLNILEDARELESVLQSERDKSVSIISSISEGLFVVDENYKIVIINPAAEKILCSSAKACVGKNPMDVVRIFKGDTELKPEDRPIVKTVKDWQNVIIGIEDNFYFQLPSGKRFPVAIATSPIKAKDLNGAVVVFRDITDDKLLDEAKSSFISIASHQLRTPLTSVRWYSEMLLDEDVGTLNKDQREFATQVHAGALRLFQTIDTLLSLSRLESGKLQQDLIKIDIRQFMDGICKDLEPLVNEKKLNLAIDLPAGLPNVLMDRFMFREVTTNLIANSIRYTDIGGNINVSFKRDGLSGPDGKTDEEQILCSVSDNGIGIPGVDKDKIFGRFYRAQNAVKKVPDGSGLGLSLVKSFVEKWGGRIWFESQVGKGTVFYFTIPGKSVFKS